MGERGTVSLACVSLLSFGRLDRRERFFPPAPRPQTGSRPGRAYRREPTHTPLNTHGVTRLLSLLWFTLLLRKTHTDALSLLYANAAADTNLFEYVQIGKAGRVYPSTHTHKSQYHSSAEPCRDSAIARRFDGWTLRGTRLWLAWSCLEPLPVSAACQLRRVAECQLCHFIRN